MNIDHVLLVIIRALTILALVGGLGWVTWKIVRIFKERGRSRRMKKDRRQRRVRVSHDRRHGARREREASREKLDAMVKEMESPAGRQQPRPK